MTNCKELVAEKKIVPKFFQAENEDDQKRWIECLQKMRASALRQNSDPNLLSPL